ncbi:MAG: DUF975 family protein [Oscillospiraceae bacterium]|nr:DUF975 family protein [Oscillospiraceae bacterium]
MKTPKDLKKHVSERIQYCWGESVMIFFVTAGAFSVFIIAWIIINSVSGAITNVYDIILSVVMELILLWLVLTPFAYGVRWYMIQQVRGESVPARGIFSCYLSLSRMFKILRLDLAITLLKLCIILPAAASAGAAYYMLTKGGNTLLYCAAAAFMLIFAALIVLYVIIGIRYSLISFIYVLKPDRPFKGLLAESRELMKGKIRYCVRILLSLTGSLIPCVLIFPAVFIVPYLQMVYTAMINEMIRQEERYADYEAG